MSEGKEYNKMINTWVSLLIVLSVALQSLVAVANSDNDHQLDAQHIQTEHSHELDFTELASDTSESEHNVKDCHHCGHCQGSHNQWLFSKSTICVTEKFIISNQYHYLAHTDKSVIEQLIRPPIA